MKSKVVVIGAPGSGVTTFLQSLGGTYHPADPNTSLSIHPESAELSIGDDQFWLPAALLNPHDFSLLEILIEDASGCIILVDSTDPKTFLTVKPVTDFVYRLGAVLPRVIAANEQDLPGAARLEVVAGALAVIHTFPVLPCVATDRDSVKSVLACLPRRSSSNSL